MTAISLTQHEFQSSRLSNTRAVWVQPPDNATPQHVCIFLDGEHYLAQMRATTIVRDLIAAQSIPPVVAAYVSAIDYDVRWPESFCNPRFAQFVAEELRPWLLKRLGLDPQTETTLVGLSLTGLSAAHAALCYPNAFQRVLCQSGSFWWEDGQLIHEVSNFPATQTVFRITCGDEETDEGVDHGKGLFQKLSQLESNQRMRDALVEHECKVSWQAFSGGHSIAAWRADLPGSLTELYGSDTADSALGFE